MKIDFSWSQEDWLAVIRELLEIVQNFFREIGINIFVPSDTGSDPDATETDG